LTRQSSCITGSLGIVDLIEHDLRAEDSSSIVYSLQRRRNLRFVFQFKATHLNTQPFVCSTSLTRAGGADRVGYVGVALD
jgi:hypothetical protein